MRLYLTGTESKTLYKVLQKAFYSPDVYERMQLDVFPEWNDVVRILERIASLEVKNK